MGGEREREEGRGGGRGEERRWRGGEKKRQSIECMEMSDMSIEMHDA